METDHKTKLEHEAKIKCLLSFILTFIFLLISISSSLFFFPSGDGCGHTVLSPTSGTLTSLNFPGTYPNHTRCEWTLRVAKGLTLLLTFGDFDLEWSQDCISGSLTITDTSGATRVGMTLFTHMLWNDTESSAEFCLHQ